jgi:uncharacterized protein YndB with AHSA1/START domain
MTLVEDVEAAKSPRRIATPPSRLYEIVTDVTRVGSWAVECEACRWLDGVNAPAVGARFEGVNRYRERVWSTISVVDEVVQDRRFAYHIEADGEPITRWHITLRPDGDGDRHRRLRAARSPGPRRAQLRDRPVRRSCATKPRQYRGESGTPRRLGRDLDSRSGHGRA